MGREIIALENDEIRDQPVLTLFDDKLRQSLTQKSMIVALCLRPEIPCSSELLEWLESWSRRFRNSGKKFFIIPANSVQFECLEVSHPDLELRYVASLDELDIVAPHREETAPVIEPAPIQAAPPAVPLQTDEPAVQKNPVNQTPAPLPVPEHRSTSTTPFRPPTVTAPVVQSWIVVQHPAPPPVVSIARPPEQKQPVPPPAPAAAVAPVEAEKTIPAIDHSQEYAPPRVHMQSGSTVRLTGEYVCSRCTVSRMWLKGDVATKCENPECRDPAAGWDLTCELF